MARVKFTNNTHNIIKRKYVEKRTFHYFLGTTIILLILLAICAYKLW